MAIYLARRVAASLLILLGTSALVFGLIFLAPADPAWLIAAQRTGGPPGAADLIYVRQAYGLDQPLVVQYGRWLWQTARGDLGYSIRTGHSIGEELQAPLRHSMLLGAVTMLVVVSTGLPTGIVAALHPGRMGAAMVRILSLGLLSIPQFWLAFLLILLFSIRLKWLPSFGAKSGWHLILPVTTLAAAHAAQLSRLSCALLREQLGRDYIRTARAKGLGPGLLLWRHLMPNVAVPLMTMLAMQASALLGGAILIETLFSWPGLGHYYLTAVTYRDIPVIQAATMLFALLALGANLLADLSYPLFDPRIRSGDS